MAEEKVSIESGELKLEGVLDLPEGDGRFPAVVVCHPHPLYGGTMDNNVVLAVCQALGERDIGSLRFNTRGAGRSEGAFGDGDGEREDVKTACAFLAGHSRVIPQRVGLAGYSFGGAVALQAAAEIEGLWALAAVSPATGPGQEAFRRLSLPKYLVSGSADAVVDPQRFMDLVASLPEPTRSELISGADHFWGGREADLGAQVAAFFAEQVGAR